MDSKIILRNHRVFYGRFSYLVLFMVLDCLPVYNNFLIGDDGIILKILSFNLGIEIGQIVALCIMVALLFNWRKAKSFAKISDVSNRGIIVAGALLCLMQMHGYSHLANADEFGFPEDNHFHAHEDIDSQKSDLMGNEYTVDP